MSLFASDDDACRALIGVLKEILPEVSFIGGAEEPVYVAPKDGAPAEVHFRSNYPRSLLHELSHYCLAGDRRRGLDDFGFWYTPCGRSEQEQYEFEMVEARPQGLEKAMCEIVGLPFTPSLDDFSGRPPSDGFVAGMHEAYLEMTSNPPPTAKKILLGLNSLIAKAK